MKIPRRGRMTPWAVGAIFALGAALPLAPVAILSASTAMELRRLADAVIVRETVAKALHRDPNGT